MGRYLRPVDGGATWVVGSLANGLPDHREMPVLDITGNSEVCHA